MKIVRGRPEARLLPSRHDFALFRLGAFVMARSRRIDPTAVDDGSALILVVDRHQSAGEVYAVAIWVELTTACFLAGSLFGGWPVLPALALSLLITPPAFQLTLHLLHFIRTAFRRGDGDHTHSNSVALMTLLGAVSLYYALAESWIRFVAWQFLAMTLANALAVIAVFFLRDRIAQLESLLGGATFVE